MLEVSVGRIAGDSHAAHAEGREARFRARLTQEARFIRAGEQVVAGRVGQNALAVEHVMEAAHESLETRLPTHFVRRAGLLNWNAIRRETR